jgi:hypothetical protein
MVTNAQDSNIALESSHWQNKAKESLALIEKQCSQKPLKHFHSSADGAPLARLSETVPLWDLLKLYTAAKSYISL